MHNNLFAYLKWRGDLTFLESPFNEIDHAILCAFSYLKIDPYLHYDKIVLLKDVVSQFLEKGFSKETLFFQNKKTLLELLKNAKRFQNIGITKFVNDVSMIEETQFCAMTFLLNEKENCVVFRGTDETLTAWKENFNLSYMPIIPAQEKAKEYLDTILMLTKKNVYVGGHSKGGNLALYSSIYCKEELKKKIIKVYNYDGPGLREEILHNDQFLLIKDKIITFIPKASIVGNLFLNDTKTIIVKSSSLGIFEHDLYTWETLESHFVYTKEMDKEIKKLCNLLNDWLNKQSKEKMQKIVNHIYEIIYGSGIYNVEEFVSNLFSLSLIDSKEFQFLIKILPILLQFLKE